MKNLKNKDNTFKYAETLHGAVSLAHVFLRERIKAGDKVVDATCGNGHDTLFLANLVGAQGTVWAFDIQDEALSATRLRHEEAGCTTQVILHKAGHEEISEYVSGPLNAVVFNLGYLPGSDRRIMTRPKTTIAALEQSLNLLGHGGIAVICIYPGHDGGREEAIAVNSWAEKLDPALCHVWTCRRLNRAETAPYLLLIEKV